MKNARVILAFLSITGMAPCAQAEGIASLNDRLAPLRKQHNVPGLAAIVFDAAGVLAEGAVGVRKQGDPIPVTTSDRWHLGSLTKSMTASLAAMLVEQGSLDMEKPLGEMQGALFEGLDAGFARITLHDILEHRAGIARDGPPGTWNILCQRTLFTTPAENRRWWAKEILTHAPGHESGKHLYSNAGYVVAGCMLEDAGARTWEELIRVRLFQPLAMSGAGFGPPASAGNVDAPWGHRKDRTPVPPGIQADNPPAIAPAGTVHSTLADLAAYARWHLTNGASHPGMLTAASFATLHTPRHPDKNGEGYACGWQLCRRPWAGGAALTHTGTNRMNFAVIWLAPDIQRGFAVVTNIGDDDGYKACDAVAGRLAADFCHPLAAQKRGAK